MPRGKKLSSRTRKQISDLPKHSQKVYQKVHQRALQHYLVPKRGKEEARVPKKPLTKLHGWQRKRGVGGKGKAGRRNSK
jgi:hypothetical protein